MLDLTNKQFGFLTATKSQYVNGKLSWLCRCVCGNTKYFTAGVLNAGRRKSCGCKQFPDNYKMIGRTFGNWTVLSKNRRINTQYFWVCKCVCGNEREVADANLRSGTSTNCGCATALDLTNQKFGSLTFLKIVGNHKKHGNLWKTICDCGQIKVVPARNRRNNQQTCGNCLNLCNGKLFSKPQLIVQGYINEFISFPSITNYNHGNLSVDIVFSIANKKIAIEYNEWYWHGSQKKQKLDEKKLSKLLKDNWKVIIFNASKDIPSKALVQHALKGIIERNISCFVAYSNNWGNGVVHGI